jgi:PRTRC genetic system protein E
MFKELLPLLDGRTVIITAAKTTEGTLVVTVYPARNGDKEEPTVAMSPLCVSGSAEELDHELPALLLGYVETIGGFRSNLAAIKVQIAEAATAAEAARSAKAAKGKPAAAPKAAATAAPAAPAAPPRADLFADSLPVVAEVPQIEGGTREGSDGLDPRIVAPPQPAPEPPPPTPAARRTRVSPIRGKAVDAAPAVSTAAVPPATPQNPADAEPIGLVDPPEPVVPAQAAPATAGSLAGAISGGSNLWSDEETDPVIDSGVPSNDDDDEDSCPF